MDKKFSDLFDNWHMYMQKMDRLYERLGVLFMDLGIQKGDVRIITFISSAWCGEIRFHDSNGVSSRSQKYLKTNDKHLAEDHLIELFDIKREQSIFTFESLSSHIKSYDEFGMILHGNEEIYSYGIVVQYHQLEYSKIIFELLNQISFYCRNVLDNEKFEIEEYMLANLVYVAFKKQIDIDFYNTLASSNYEKIAASGGILINHGAQQYDLQISFNEKYPLEIKNVRQIRKLLEMTTDKLFLIAENGNVIGISDYRYCSDNFDYILFSGHQVWSYHNNDKELLSYKEGKYTFIFDNNRNFIVDFPNNFIDEIHYGYLNSILYGIRQQKRGTLLIISDEAKNEVERLCHMGRGYAINPIDLKNPGSKNLLSSLISIDGAIFIDINLLCYGVGVILDGIAVKTGLSSRGARYNSAKCYIDNKGSEKFVAIVVSEDDTIDIIYHKDE